MTRSTVTPGPASAWKLLTVALLVVALLGSADARRRRNKDTDGDKVKNGWVTDSWIDFSWTVCSPCFLIPSTAPPMPQTKFP
jgi:hypothetical protein